MIDQLPSLKQLLKQLQQVPYLASKNLYRVANHFLVADEQKVQQFCRILLEAKKNLTRCEICCVLKEYNQPCVLCAAPRRDKSLVCVVETWQDVMVIERSGGYMGSYHVLGGAICPLEGIGPDDLSIRQLVTRVAAGGINEIVFALSQTPEGEATAAFIAKKIQDYNVTLSSVARGMPVGSSLEYMDRLTVYKALSERRPF